MHRILSHNSGTTTYPETYSAHHPQTIAPKPRVFKILEQGRHYRAERNAKIRHVFKHIGTTALVASTAVASLNGIILVDGMWDRARESSSQTAAWKAQREQLQADSEVQAQSDHKVAPKPPTAASAAHTYLADNNTSIIPRLRDIAMQTGEPVVADIPGRCDTGTDIPKKWPNRRPLSITQYGYSESGAVAAEKIYINPVSFTRSDENGDVYICGTRHGVGLVRGQYGEPLGYGDNEIVVASVNDLDQYIGGFMSCTDFWDQSAAKIERDPTFDPTMRVSALAC